MPVGRRREPTAYRSSPIEAGDARGPRALMLRADNVVVTDEGTDILPDHPIDLERLALPARIQAGPPSDDRGRLAVG